MHELDDAALWSVAQGLEAPLTTIANAVELLIEDLDELETNDLRGAVSAIQRQTMRLEWLVESLLAAVTIRRSGLRLHPQPLSPADVVADAVAAVEPLLAARGQRVSVSVYGALASVDVWVDARRLGQVVIGLLHSLQQRAAPGATLRVRVTRGAARHIRVHLSATAAPAQKIVRVPLAPQTAGAASEVESSPLVLAISRYVLEQHGSALHEETGAEPGFWFDLPTGQPVAAGGVS